MPLRVICPGCEAAFRVPESAAGKRANCPKCSSTIPIGKPKPSKQKGAVGSRSLGPQPASKAKTGPPPAVKLPQQPAKKPPAVAPGDADLAALAAEAERLDSRLTAKQIAAAFAGPIKPVDQTAGYRNALRLSLVTMLATLAVYVGIVLAGAVWLVSYAVDCFPWGTGAGATPVSPMTYFLLVGGGLGTLAAMVWPLFYRPPRSQRVRSLTRKHEPVLFAFVDCICKAVSAPQPSRIEINCDVNASARLDKGVFSKPDENLVLTIGLPLVAGMSTRQFGGVLAHEFGHFNQTGGMRLSYALMRLNHWLQLVIFGGDPNNPTHSADADTLRFHPGMLIFPPLLVLWLARRLLWLLFLAGMTVAGYASRQMEFDADRYEARLAGSKTFAATCRRLVELNAASQLAYEQLFQTQREGRLVDDLPRLIVKNVEKLPDEAEEFVKKHLDENETRWYDTHPSNKDRIASAAEERAPGVLKIDTPAKELFSNFIAQSKATTLELYRERIGPQINQSHLKPVSKVIADADQTREGYQRLTGYFQQAVRAYRPLPIGSGYLSPPPNPDKVAKELRAAHRAVAEGVLEARSLLDDYDKAEERYLKAITADTWHSAGMRINKKEIESAFHTQKSCRGVRDREQMRLGRIGAQLEPFETQMAKRLRSALVLLQTDEVAAQIKRAPRLLQRAGRLLPVVVAIDGQMGTLNKASESQIMLAAILNNLNHEPDQQLVGAIERITDRIHPSMLQVWEVLKNQPYPFDHRDEEMTLGMFALPAPPDRRDIVGVLNTLPEMMDRIIDVRGRALGELAQIAEQVEEALGLEPLPDAQAPVPSEVDAVAPLDS